MRFLIMALVGLLMAGTSMGGGDKQGGAFELVAPSVRAVEQVGSEMRIEWTGMVVNHSEKTWRGRLIVVFLDSQKKELRRAPGDDFTLGPWAQAIATGNTLHPARAWAESKEVRVLVDMWETERL